MKLRLSLALITCLLGVSLIPGTAAADQPTKEEFSPVGDQFVCGETVLTITSGTVVELRHEHELRSGRVRVIFVDLPQGVTATDEEGVVYRVVGSPHGNFTSPDPEAEGGEIGFFSFRINFIGPDGLFGKVNFRLQVKRNGDEVVREKGNCEFAEDDEE